MTSPAPSDDVSDADGGQGRSARDRALRRVAAARTRFKGSWVDALIAQLKTLDIGEWTLAFGAELLWSVLPLLILLSSLANTRIDDDLSRHIGLDTKGAHIVEALFRSRPSHELIPIVTGVLFSLAGTIAVASSIQVLYERAFTQEHRERRRWSKVPRLVVWVVVLIGVLVAQAVIAHPVRVALGPVVQGLLRFLEATIFFWWTMHFLLRSRAPWRTLLRPALVTALLWLGLALFSSHYFSSAVISDSREYGEIGVVFGLLTWFVLIGGVFVLGATLGAVWQDRRGTPWLAARQSDESG
jgi:membrane protein